MPSVVRRPATAEPARRRVQRLVDRVTRGYLVKGATKTEVARALHDVAAGGAVFGEGVAEQVLLRACGSPRSPAASSRCSPWSPAAPSNAAISGRLFLSDKTVRNVVSNVSAKLGARDRPDAILLARRAGLGELR